MAKGSLLVKKWLSLPAPLKHKKIVSQASLYCQIQHEWERPKKNGLPIPLHYLIYIMIGSLVINSHKTVIFSW